jgi:hypothetical protein
MPAHVRWLFVALTAVASSLFVAHGTSIQNSPRTVILEVVRNSWDTERNETLVYLRVYSDGFAEAHPMRKVDFRDVRFATKQLSADELGGLKHLLTEPATMQLQSTYSRYWGNKDFGHRYTVTISAKSQKQLELVNFDPFLAQKDGKAYPEQLERLGCSIWKLRTEVSGESLEKNWLDGCVRLGY